MVSLNGRFVSLQVDQAAAGLLALGMKKGDRLGMWGPNTYEWILFQFATAKAGIILVSQSSACCSTRDVVRFEPKWFISYWTTV